MNKLFDPYLFDSKPTSKFSLSFNSIKGEKVILEKINYSKEIDFLKRIIFKKTIFKKIDFESEIIILSVLEALSKYFTITIRLLIIDIVNKRNFQSSSSDSFAIFYTYKYSF